MFQCTQGATRLRLRVLGASPWRAEFVALATFEFARMPPTWGEYLVHGSVRGSADGRLHVHLTPGEWLRQPRGAVPVGADTAAAEAPDEQVRWQAAVCCQCARGPTRSAAHGQSVRHVLQDASFLFVPTAAPSRASLHASGTGDSDNGSAEWAMLEGQVTYPSCGAVRLVARPPPPASEGRERA